MAENTRNQAVMREVEERLLPRMALEMEERLDSRLEEKLTPILRMLARLEERINGPQQQQHSGSTSTSEGRARIPAHSCGGRGAKWDFPKFSGAGVKQWILQCETYFFMDQTPEEYKVRMAVMHLEGKAMHWHSAYIKAVGMNNLPSWEEYARLLTERFDDICEDPMAELMKLRQKGSVIQYHEEFDCIVAKVTLAQEHQLSCFLGGLRPEVQTIVRMFQPTTVRKAFELAKLYEGSPSSHSGGFSRATKSFGNVAVPDVSRKPVISSKPSIGKNLSPTFMAERRAKGLCYFCDEPFSYEHSLKHRKLQVHVLEVEDFEMNQEQEGMVMEVEEDDVTEPIISVNAMTGVADFRTMRITGYYGKKPLHILIDSGSTHNFLNETVAQKLGCRVEAMDSLNVTVADGNRMRVAAKVREFQWKLQNTNFVSNMMLLPLECCDVVLGVEWLVTLGDIIWNFDKLTMEFVVHGRRHVLRGTKGPKVRTIKQKNLEKTLVNGVHLAMLTVTAEETDAICYTLTTHASQENVQPEIEELLLQYEDIFNVPVQLPPCRPGYDHKIILEEGTNPINMRPYRYGKRQKDVIDSIIQEYLQAGVIQRSESPFASPVVLVGKKDGSWRMCIDYRELNGRTVKNKFPIPLVEDLMDELHGAQIFSKIDLRAGYNQVRMCPDDVQKTAFRTHSGHYEYLVMPFGLTNAPTTFQSLMNAVFQSFLRKFILVFFDDILIYSAGLQEHLEHLQQVLELMRKHSLFAKRSKCYFGVEKVEYLGHFISSLGIATDPSKVEAVRNWPLPKTIKQLRSFLGLAGYYQRFVAGYGAIAKPLTDLLKKDNFVWNSAATDAFLQLKARLITAPVLALPDFSKPFTVEVDASGLGVGAVLMQDHHPLAFISRPLNAQQQTLSTYEKELLALVMAVMKWRHYLLGKQFIIKTDHKSLKHILEQKLSTSFQQKWLVKLLEFDFTVEYRKGTENVAADALSRRDSVECNTVVVMQPGSEMLSRIRLSWNTDDVQRLIKEVQASPVKHKHYTWREDELRRKNKLVVGKDEQLRLDLLGWFHASPSGGHSGRGATLRRVKAVVYWKGLTTDVRKFVSNCVTCQANKNETVASPGLLQPLPIPGQVCQHVTMDFVEGLPKSEGKQVVMVVVDRLSKAAHFVALSHPYTAVQVAQAFLDNVFKLHGFPSTITSDCDPIFVSNFWREFLSLQGVQLQMSTAYHPQTDGQSEIVNKCLETYLRCMCSDVPSSWAKWLALAEWWYNSTYHSSIKSSPFEIVYSQPPPIHLPYFPGEAKVAAVERSLQKRDEMMKLLKFHLSRVQNRMKQSADRKRTDRTFNIGDLVWLKLHVYRQTSVSARVNAKLAPKFYGPFRVLDKIGSVAYKLQLPTDSMIHNVFHVSQLRRFVGELDKPVELPKGMEKKQTEPECILDRMTVKRGNRAVTKVLVKWKNQLPEDATWEFYVDLLAKFPRFDP